MIIFETNRLRVRPLQQADLPDFQIMQGDAQVMQYITGIPLTPKQSTHDLSTIIARYDVAGNETWVWAVVTKKDDFVGTCAVFKNEMQKFEVAYRLQKSCWGQGYGQEIADGLIDYCLNELALESVVAQAVKDNVASVKILERSRLTFVTLINNQEKNWVERHYRYQVTANTYFNNKG